MSEPVKYFLYYIPGLRNARDSKEKVLDIVGPAIEGAQLYLRDVGDGPGKNSTGLLCAAVSKRYTPESAEIEKRLEYCADPKRQPWMDCGGFWIGYHADLKPCAEDLKRSTIVGGYHYTCPESGRWIVPLARKVDGGTLFDQRIVYQPDKTIIKAPLSRYKDLCNFAEDHWEFLSSLQHDEEGLDIEADQKYCDVACEAIGVNYHTGPFELTALEMLTMNAAVMVCGYLCDWPGLMEILTARADASKKNNTTKDSSNTSSGEDAA